LIKAVTTRFLVNYEDSREAWRLKVAQIWQP